MIHVNRMARHSFLQGGAENSTRKRAAASQADKAPAMQTDQVTARTLNSISGGWPKHGFLYVCVLLLSACGGGAAPDPGGSPPPPPPPPITITKAEAFKFLNQATFGATEAAAQQLSSVGYDAWIDQEMAKGVSLQLPFVQALPRPQNVA